MASGIKILRNESIAFTLHEQKLKQMKTYFFYKQTEYFTYLSK